MNATDTILPRPLATQFDELGFEATGPASWCRSPLVFRRAGAWWTCTVDATSPQQAVTGALGEPGLFKRVASSGGTELVCDLPDELLRLCGSDEWAGPQSLLAAVVQWLEGCARPESDWSMWQSPDPAHGGIYPEPGQLTFGAGRHRVQGELMRQPGRLAVRVPLVAQMPAAVGAAGRAWCEALLREATNRFRMVRLGTLSHVRTSLVAEIDLTGAPAQLVPLLLPIGLAALASAVRSILGTLRALADENAEFALLDVVGDPDSWN